MIQLTLAETVAQLHPEAIINVASDVTFEGMSIDTRTLTAGNLFAALKGQKANGHDFVEAAHASGAALALVEHKVDSGLPQLIVPNVEIALGKLSAYWRRRFQIPFIAVTGSNGKTTLKNMIASILKAACNNNEAAVLSTIGTLNNQLGLPLTLARLNAYHRYAVIEMGMNHFGEIEYLSRLTEPQVAVITNAASAHLESLGNVAGVAKAKAEIFLGLNKNGIAVLNRDDAFYPFWREQIGQQSYLTFGYHPDADIRTDSIETQDILLKTPQGTINLHLPLLGRHNVMNVLAAAAATLAIGIDLTAIQQGIESLQAAPGRLNLHTLPNGVNIIDDSYNANPMSLQAAVETLTCFAGKKILVLGDMKELGKDAKAIHQIAGQEIRAAGIDYLFTYGELSANAALGFGEGAYHFNEQDKLVNALKPFLSNQTTILIKGSRSMRMEKVVTDLIQ